MVLKMNFKKARGLWVDEQIFELQSQMAMVQRVLEKLGKVKSMDGRTPYCHPMPTTDQEMSSSLPNESENFVGVEFFLCSHEEEVEGYSNLFHDEQVLGLFSNQFDPNSPPIFDSYEQEYELHEAKPPIYDDLNSLGLLPSGSCAKNEEMAAATSCPLALLQLQPQANSRMAILMDEVPLIGGLKFGDDYTYSGINAPEWNLISPLATPNGLNQTHTQLDFAKHDPPMFWESFFAPKSHSSSVKGSKQSRGNSFKNCYVFKREGLHSVLIFMEEASLKFGVHTDPGVGNNSVHNTQSLLFVPCIAQPELPYFVPKASAFKVPWTHGPGLLDFYIEDDELKDKGVIDHLNSSIEHIHVLSLKI